MRKFSSLLFFLNISLVIFSQEIIDPCFQSIGLEKNMNINEREKSEEINESKDIKLISTVLLQWETNHWVSDSLGTKLWWDDMYIPPNTSKLYRVINTGLATDEDRCICLRLDKPMQKGQELQYIFYYASDTIHRIRGEYFYPKIYSNNKPMVSQKGRINAFKIFSFAPTNNLPNWQIDTVSFTVSKEQDGHDWLIIVPDELGLGVVAFSLDCGNEIEIGTKDNLEKKKEKKKVMVYFAYNSYELTQKAKYVLDNSTTHLKKQNKIVIEGYCDNIGSVLYNLKLSKRRALAVKNYLVKKGVSASKIKCYGKGSLGGSSIEERENNRRITINN